MSVLDKLFDRANTTAWMQVPDLRRQLPFLYRLFANFCVLQTRVLGGTRIRKGPEMYDAVRKMTTWFSQPNSCRLSLGHHVVFLDLFDARFFRVIAELIEHNPEAAAVKHFLKEGDTFIDVGANHGSFSIIAAHQVGDSGYLLAIEPQVRLANLVTESLKENAACEFDVSTLACGDRNGEIEFHVPKDWSGTAGVFASHSATKAHSTSVVPVRRFDESFDWQSFPGDVFVKLDIEGSEYAFLQGARDFLSARTPPILIEVHPGSLDGAGVSWEQISTFLREVGYRSYLEIDDLETELPLAELNADSYRNVVVLGRLP